MAKDVNIHVKTTGTQQVSGDLKNVSHSTEQVGSSVQAMGEKGQAGSNRFIDGIKKIIGPLGFMAMVGVVGRVAGAISSFFDTLKKRCDEAVQKVSEVRTAFSDLFETMNAFDEKSRKRVTEENTELLKETSVSVKEGVPIITEYARQFRPAIEQGKITEKQYQQGLRDMLGYGARHGQEATPELITLMSGLGMMTPGQQGAFRRQITELSGQTGMTDKDIIEILGRSMPTIKAMGWTPEQALNVIGIIAKGEIGRAKTALPATTLEALSNPNATDIEKNYGIAAKDAQSLFIQVSLKSQKMDQQAKLEMLQNIYGSAAPGIYKLITSKDNYFKLLSRAAGPEGEKAEKAEEAASRQTMERIQAKTDADIILDELRTVTTPEEYKKQIRQIGESKRDIYRRRQPVSQWLREIILSNEEEKESAAMRAWWESLSKEEQEKISKQYQTSQRRWESYSPEEQYRILTDLDKRQPQQPPSLPSSPPLTIVYHHDTIYNPIAGTAADREMGPRADRDLR